MHDSHPDVHLAVLRTRSAALRREADLWRLARAASSPRSAPRARRTAAVRRRIGWALVEAGLCLVHSGRGAPVP
ncbi:hypothetical protein [Streptomyces megasporus]|uniref:hypothetical protein n=1 Tax=Streptomyces megasporus TaxID=44060 RepID=UPI0004E18ABB|nr:hypothetical protein [Streptomyces megasporus]